MDFLFDSNILIALFKEDDANHKNALDIIHSIENFYISEYSLVEVSTVLLFKASKDIATKAMKYMSDNKNIIISRFTNEELLEICRIFPYDKKLSFVDFCLIKLAKNKKLELLSFDKDLMKEYRKF
jgi:predicted nucleic acid-binding protein